MSCAYLYVHNFPPPHVSHFGRDNLAILKKRRNGTDFNAAQSVQDHAGAVGGGEPAVAYTYEDGASGGVAKCVRLQKITYPGASREVYYRYGTSVVNSALSPRKPGPKPGKRR